MHTIRRLKLGEAASYREIRLESLRESPAAFTTTYESALKRDSNSWISQADASAQGSDRATFIVFINRPIGLVALYRDTENPHQGELIQMWISPDHRGSSVATDLMNHVFEWASRHDFHTIRAEVTEGNLRAFRFYEKYGFERVDSDRSDIILTKKVEQGAAANP
jgi:RimJ/RimL family protein N-acetyltransferase